MREILFKAKRIDNGEWVEGYYVYVDYLDKHCIVNRIKNPRGVDFIVQMTEHDVDVKTLCQYTDLTDKNGNKIWENDIMKYEWDGKTRIEVIKYQAPIFTYDKSFRWSLHKDEVIGNIFDNAELLERN